MMSAGMAKRQTVVVRQRLERAELEHRLVELESHVSAAVARGVFSCTLPLEPFRDAFADGDLQKELERLGYKVEHRSRRGHAPMFNVSWGGAMP